MKVFESGVYKKWYNKLKDERASIIIDIRIKRLSTGNPGKCRFLGKITELIIDYGPGYRVYYTTLGKEIIILLCGGDKSTQQEDIKKARMLAALYEMGKGE